MNLWTVVYNTWDDNSPTYGAHSMNLGPLAYAPTATGVATCGPWARRPADNQRLGNFVYWCAREDLSLRQSWLDAGDSTWHTVTIDPGPMASAPAQLVLPSGELHLFWCDQDGRLIHKWALDSAKGSAGRADGWQTEVMDAGPMGSEPSALYNQERQQIYVFWLDREGKLNQTSQNAEGNEPRWQTTNIAPATGDVMTFKNL